ncbi:hypothetical protein [Isoptericola sp. NPDC055881]
MTTDDEGSRWGTVRILSEPPTVIGRLLGDAVHGARTALDYLAFELAGQDGAGQRRGKTSFPIAETEGKWPNQAKTQLPGVDANVRHELYKLQPWAGGDDDFWLLHQLDIADKHRHLLVAAARGALFLSTEGSMIGTEEVSPLKMKLCNLRLLRDGERIQLSSLGSVEPTPEVDMRFVVRTETRNELVLAPGMPGEMTTLEEVANSIERVREKVEPLVARLR